MTQYGETTSDGLKIFGELQGPARNEPQPTLILDLKLTNLSETDAYLIPPFYHRLGANIGDWADLGHDVDFGMAGSRSSGRHRFRLLKGGEIRLRNHFRLGYHGIEAVERRRKGRESAPIQFVLTGIVNAFVEDVNILFQHHFEISLFVHSGVWEEWLGAWTRETVPVYLPKDMHERLLKIPKAPRDLVWIINELISHYEATHAQTQ